MSKLHLSILFFDFLIIVVKESHGSLTLDLGTELVASAFTSYKKNGDVNMEAVPEMAEKYAKDGIKAILIGSYAGEGPSMDLCTRKELIETWVRAGIRLGLKILVDAGGMAFPDLLKLVKFCSEIEVTAVFVLPSIAYKAKNVDEIIEDLKAIYKVAPKLHIIYHDLEFLTQPVVSSIEVFIEASSKIPTFCGMATSMGNAIELRRILGPKKDKLVIVIGNDVNAPLVLKIGIHLSVWPSLFPKLCLRIVAAAKAGDCAKAADIQLELSARILCISKLKGEDDLDYASRSFLENCKLSYKYITGLDLRQRLPLREVDASHAANIKSCLLYQGAIIDRY